MTLELWQDRAQKKLDPELFSKKAEEFAIQIDQDSKISKGMNKGTQLRKFFDEVLRLNAQAQVPGADWNLILPQVYMVIAKTAYAHGRGLVSKRFVDHMRQGIEQIESKEDLRIFTNHLEAFTGFYKMYNQN